MQIADYYYLQTNIIVKKGAFKTGEDYYVVKDFSDQTGVIDPISYKIIKEINNNKSVNQICDVLSLTSEEKIDFFSALESEELITPMKNEYRLYEKKCNKGLRSLDYVNLILTDKCNYNCSFCYRESNPNKNEYLNYSKLESLLISFEKLGVIDIAISGGEPLLVPYLKEFLLELQKKHYRINLQTNSFLLDKWVAFFRENNLPNRITTSCDTINGKDGHSLNKIENNLKKIIDLGISISVNMTILPNLISQNEFYKLYSKLKKIGITKISISNTIPTKKSEIAEFKESLEWAEFIKTIEKEDSNLDTNQSNNYFINNAALSLICGAGEYSCTIAPNGNILPCAVFKDFGLNLPENYTFHEFWSKDSTFSQFRNPSKLLESCKNCTFFTYCKGGCKAKAYYSSNSIYEKDPWSCKLFNLI